MAIYQHTIKPADGSIKKKKRVGRGNASGHGTYSTRGLKGQKSRSGVSGLKKLGLKMVLLRVPKKRGFKSPYPDNQVVNLVAINENFKDSDKINPAALAKKHLIRDANAPVKILGKGELKLKGLEFSQVTISESAKGQIEKMSGKIGE